jgi:hypothetical protein
MEQRELCVYNRKGQDKKRKLEMKKIFFLFSFKGLKRKRRKGLKV